MPVFYCDKCQVCPNSGSCPCGKVTVPQKNHAVCHQTSWTTQNLGRGAVIYRKEPVYGKGHPLAGRAIADPRRK